MRNLVAGDKEFEAVWTSRAEADLQRIFSSLEDLAEGKGLALLERVELSIQLVQKMPEMAPFYLPPVRRMVLKNPRFGLFYTVESRGLIIHAVMDLTQSRETILRHLHS